MESVGSGIPHRKNRCLHEPRQQLRPPGDLPSLQPGVPESQAGGCRSAQRPRNTEEGDTRSDCAPWLLAQKPWIVPIPGTRRLERLEENVGAAEVELTSDDFRDIDNAFSKIKVQRARLPEDHSRGVRVRMNPN